MGETLHPQELDKTKPLWSRLVLPLAALAVVLIVASTGRLSLSEFERSRGLREEVRQSYERRAQLQALLSMHQDIETGQRGYVLTSDESFLEPYNAARSHIGQKLVELETGLGSGFPLQQDVTLLKLLSARKLRVSEQAIALQRSGKSQRSVEMIAEGSGKRTMDGLRRAVANIDSFERKQLRHRLDKSRRATERAETLSIALQCLLLLLLAFAGWLIRRSFLEKQAALRRVEDLNVRQSAIFDAAKDGMIVLNASGSIESLNPAAARMFGYSSEELLRRDVGVLFEVAPDQGDVESFLKRLQRRRRSDLNSVQEIWAKRRDGSTFPGDVSVSPVHLFDTVRYVAIVRDNSERKQIEQMKTEFVSTVSHELRTPLTSIAGALGLLKGGAVGSLPGPALRLLELAHNNSQRLIRLVNDILDIEKIESGSVTFDVRPTPLLPLLQQAVDSNSSFAAAHRVRLVLSQHHPDAQVMADPDRIAQIATNLISNAVKFSPPGAAVRISLTRLDRQFRITVADRGPGVPHEFRQRIFNKFAQADSSDTRQGGGTGLGLSIVKEIVTRLGGNVSFEDRMGGGTCFHVDLPALEGAAPRVEHRRFGDAIVPRILHIEDDPDVAQLVQQAFGERADVEIARSLAAARASLKNNAFHVVIADSGLPDGSGADLLREVRDRSGPAPALVIFSAEETSSCLTGEVDAVFTKSRATLDRLVDTALDLAAHPTKIRAVK